MNFQLLLLPADYLSVWSPALAQLCFAMLEPQPSIVARASIRDLKHIRAGIE
ncbi:hypothetical protein [Methanomethylovorans sp.]|uniref:hypothetical protein n=1 Tax=Methanomethylovorans sp. TaxID=2758717 RepID=UPI001BD68BB2|nr:hypothetical protein [Methanomethylovorans sp.]